MIRLGDELPLIDRVDYPKAVIARPPEVCLNVSFVLVAPTTLVQRLCKAKCCACTSDDGGTLIRNVEPQNADFAGPWPQVVVRSERIVYPRKKIFPRGHPKSHRP
jgi:hypothetical protein